jgi:N,N'-diacetyllegionaminate synthase
MKDIAIENRPVGKGHLPFIIGEVAQNHDGSLGMAHAYIDALASAGVDAVKFQTHLADYESTLDEPFRVKFSLQDETRYDYWKRMEFTEEQWQGLVMHAREKGLVFLSTPFSLEAFRLLSRIGMSAWKVGSGEFKSKELMLAMGQTGSPILFSTGMSSFKEIVETVIWFESHGYRYALLQCTSGYPVKLEEVGLNVIDEFRKRFECPVGLSDHSGSIFPGLAALARGLDILEVHATIDRRLFGPDVKASLTIDEIRILVEAKHAFSVMDRNPVDKDSMARKLSPMRDLFTKSIAPLFDLPAGTIISEEMITAKKPGTGIPCDEKGKVIGRRLIRDVKKNKLLEWKDFEDDE